MNVLFKIDKSTTDQFAETPDDFYNRLNEQFGPFNYDPCPASPQFDGLADSCVWGTNCYVNPPFNNLKRWLIKAIAEWNQKSSSIIFLMPVRIHTLYFQDLVYPLIQSGLVDWYVHRGSFKFKNYKNTAPFGVMYLHFKKHK